MTVREAMKGRTIEWILLILLLLFSVLTVSYRDMMETNYNSALFLDTLFSRDFFRMSEIFSNDPYSITFKFVYAIGFFPVWICGKIVGNPNFPESAFAIIWMKFVLVLFLSGIVYEMDCIARELKFDRSKRKEMVFFFLSSLFVFLPVFQVGQYDVICLFFIVCGIRYCIEGKKCFLIFFAIAAPMKYFAFFVFIPLVLLTTKNILKICVEYIAGLSVVVFEKIFFGIIGPKIYSLLFLSSSVSSVSGSQDNTSAGAEFVSNQLQFLLKNKIKIGDAEASIFVLAFAVICIIAFSMKVPKHKEPRAIVTISFFSYLVFFLFSYSWNSYWIVLIAPFFILLVFEYDNNIVFNIIMEMIISGGVVIGKMIHQGWVFGGGLSFSKTLLASVPQRNIQVLYLLEKYKIVKYYSVFYGITIACVLGFVGVIIAELFREKGIINTNQQKEVIDKNRDVKIGRFWYWARLLIIILFILAEVQCEFIE